VVRLWHTCRRVLDDPAAAAWLRSRGLESAAVEDRDLLRALPTDVELPNWARYRGAPWNETGHRLIVAMHGCSGAIETLHARCVAPKDEKGRDKAASPAGVEIRGSVMADPLAQQLLAGGAWPLWAVAHDIVVCEGVPDFLTWASIGRDAADAPAVIGVVSGSWTDAIAARIPPGSRVVVRTHHDDAGNKYAAQIIRSLRGRCELYRSAS